MYISVLYTVYLIMWTKMILSFKLECTQYVIELKYDGTSLYVRGVLSFLRTIPKYNTIH